MGEEWLKIDRRENGSVLVIPWRVRGDQLASYCAIPFALLLVYLAVTSSFFQPIHRSLMGGFAVIIAYFVVTQLINATRITVSDGNLRVEHGPLPWRSPVELPVDQIRTLGVDRPSKRLLLRTSQGEELFLIESVPSGLADKLDAAIKDELGVG